VSRAATTATMRQRRDSFDGIIDGRKLWSYTPPHRLKSLIGFS
jgi:hypothetical protein